MMNMNKHNVSNHMAKHNNYVKKLNQKSSLFISFILLVQCFPYGSSEV